MKPVSRIEIRGGGIAGSAAALTALRLGAGVCIAERSQDRRHKVCGEFLSPEVQIPLEHAGVWDRFLAANPARVRRVLLNFGTREKSGLLPEPAWGLSRFAFDHLLLSTARERGAELVGSSPSATIIATGRTASAPKGDRLFGFKAHFSGPVDDAVELYFFRGGYLGINSVENGATNVCGLAPESLLRKFQFDVDVLVDSLEVLRSRLRPMSRLMPWLHVGPLVFQNRLQESDSAYFAGDALSFVDPFTGSGMLCALLTGALAGECAVHGVPVVEFRRSASRLIGRSFSVASFFRSIAKSQYASTLATLVPAGLLFAVTRPKSTLK